MDNPPNDLPAERLNGDGDAPSGDGNDDPRHREQVIASTAELGQPDDAFARLERPSTHGEAVLRTVSQRDLPV